MISLSGTLLAAGQAAWRRPICRVTVEQARLDFGPVTEVTPPGPQAPINGYSWKFQRLSVRRHDESPQTTTALGACRGAPNPGFRLPGEDGFIWSDVDILSALGGDRAGLLATADSCTVQLFSQDGEGTWHRQSSKGISLTGNLHPDHFLDASEDVLSWQLDLPEEGPAACALRLANPGGKYTNHALLSPGNLLTIEAGYRTEAGDEYALLGRHRIVSLDHATGTGKDELAVKTQDLSASLDTWRARDDLYFYSQYRLFDNLATEGGNVAKYRGIWEYQDYAIYAYAQSEATAGARCTGLIGESTGRVSDQRASSGTLRFEMRAHGQLPAFMGCDLWLTGDLAAEHCWQVVYVSAAGRFYLLEMVDGLPVEPIAQSGPIQLAADQWYSLYLWFKDYRVAAYLSADGGASWTPLIDHTIPADHPSWPEPRLPGHMALECTGTVPGVSFRELFVTDMNADVRVEDVLRRVAGLAGLLELDVDSDLTDVGFDPQTGMSGCASGNVIVDFAAQGGWGLVLRGSLVLAVTGQEVTITEGAVTHLRLPNVCGVSEGRFRLSLQDRFVALWEETGGLVFSHYLPVARTGCLGKAGGVSGVRIAELDDWIDAYEVTQGTAGRQVFADLLDKWRVYWFLRGDGRLRASRFLDRTPGLIYQDSLVECRKALSSSKWVTHVQVEVADGTGNYLDVESAARYGYRFAKLNVPELQTGQDGYHEAQSAVRQALERSNNREFAGAAQVAQERQDLVRVANARDGTTVAEEFVVSALSFTYTPRPLAFDMRLTTGFLSERLRREMRRERPRQAFIRGIIVAVNAAGHCADVQVRGSGTVLYNVLVPLSISIESICVGDVTIVYPVDGIYFLNHSYKNPSRGHASPYAWDGTWPVDGSIPWDASAAGGNTGAPGDRYQRLRYNGSEFEAYDGREWRAILRYRNGAFEGYTGSEWRPISTGIYVLKNGE